ncbi:MAG: DNA cytosine methyltransferase [Oscillospiraceae bacterium]|nr:DNA cytosine methyltransferase [Oscillospiraceae bacterium]
MRHVGDITALLGHELEPVDVVTGGSPCQDLSVAGKREGLSGERSGLFMEQIRIIKELRQADEQRRTGQPIRPRHMVWENVPGAFSSNKGEDIRVVLEETARIAEPDAIISRPPGGKWSTSGCIMGDGWSIAWRVLDAQFWGVPQRRRRIALVADFGGQSAPEILFERNGVPGNPVASGAEREGVARGVADGIGGTEYLSGWDVQDKRIFSGRGVSPTLSGCDGGGGRNPAGIVYAGFNGHKSITGSIQYAEGVSPTLEANMPSNICEICRTDQTGSNGLGICEDIAHTLDGATGKAVFESHGQDSRYRGPLDVSPTCARKWGTGGGNVPLVAGIDCRNHYENDGVSATLQAKESGGQSLNYINPVRIEQSVRRLTPLECERLQGYPDGWTDIPDYIHNGKRRTASDTARYQALGNSIALPPWVWILGRISAQYGRTATLGSLFDGIGGFPLIWERINGGGSAAWASEIEPFCIAVTEHWFNGAGAVI